MYKQNQLLIKLEKLNQAEATEKKKQEVRDKIEALQTEIEAASNEPEPFQPLPTREENIVWAINQCKAVLRF